MCSGGGYSNGFSQYGGGNQRPSFGGAAGTGTGGFGDGRWSRPDANKMGYTDNGGMPSSWGFGGPGGLGAYGGFGSNPNTMEVKGPEFSRYGGMPPPQQGFNPNAYGGSPSQLGFNPYAYGGRGQQPQMMPWGAPQMSGYGNDSYGALVSAMSGKPQMQPSYAQGNIPGRAQAMQPGYASENVGG